MDEGELHDYVHGDLTGEFSSGYAGDDVWDLESAYSEYEEAVFHNYKESIKISAKEQWHNISKKWHAVYALGAKQPEKVEQKTLDGYSTEYCRVQTTEADVGHDHETVEACEKLVEMVALRKKWLQFEESKVEDVKNLEFSVQDGTFIVQDKSSGQSLVTPIGFPEFAKDTADLMAVQGSGVVTSFAKNQLNTLSTKFALYSQLNGANELTATQSDKRDYFNINKVDNNIHLTSSMTSQHLSDFITKKIQQEGDVVVMERDGKDVTLQELVSEMNLEVVNVDTLNIMADQTLFRRFDKFDSKLNPCGSEDMREMFLKTNNSVNGRFLAEIVQEMTSTLEERGNVYLNLKVSIYGKDKNEWYELAKWIQDHDLDNQYITWCIQIPRQYQFMFKDNGNQVKTFQDMLNNIFEPLFEATLDPEGHPEVASLLDKIGSFDCVGDEGGFELHFSTDALPPAPEKWNRATNPPFQYYMYYLSSNLFTLNQLRSSLGYNKVALVPHCGVSGALDHLGCAFLLTDAINHGLELAKSPVLEYLFYLTQIPIFMSPLANNAIFVQYDHNPFLEFFHRGMNVALATDDPLQFHFTDNPLAEEYSVASQVWKLNQIDLSEIARNSVINSVLPGEKKSELMGQNWQELGVQANDIAFTNLPNMRVAFRQDNLAAELNLINAVASKNQEGSSSSAYLEIESASSSSKQSTLTQACSGDFCVSFVAVHVEGMEHTFMDEDYETMTMLKHTLAKRATYMNEDLSVLEQDEIDKYSYELKKGVFHLTYEGTNVNDLDTSSDLIKTRPLYQFLDDLQLLQRMCLDGPVKSLAYRRLQYLDQVWNLHQNWNMEREKHEQARYRKDFYNVVKVDNHVHLASAMTARQLMRFIINKVKTEPEKVVKVTKEGEEITLGGLYESIGVPVDQFNVAIMDVMADKSTFQRFDRFNAKYSPAGNSMMREVFMKTGNHIKGEYFAEVTRTVLDSLEEGESSMSEFRISIYGRSSTEWDNLAEWVVDNNLLSSKNRWMIQFPRIFTVLKDHMHAVTNFQEMLEYCFRPLFEVTMDPESHPKLAKLLEHVSGFDSVDDESKRARQPNRFNVPEDPEKWDMSENPPYNYYLYYLYANIRSLNRLRSMRGLNVFTLRPHAGEAGHPIHLSGCFLLAKGINHGILLHTSPTLQYLYYLAQIGVAVSPLSNNSLFLEYDRNPFPKFFRRGLNVSLTTDDPLQFHFTEQPLVEEYSVAAQVWKLSNVDVCEIATNSIRQSGFEDDVKQELLGEEYIEEFGKDVELDASKTSVPLVRQAFRSRTLKMELELVNQ